MTLIKKSPDTGHDISKYHDKERIERLEPGCRHLPTKDITVGLIGCKKSQRSSCLLVSRPKKDNKERHNINYKNTATLYFRQRTIQQNGNRKHDTSCKNADANPIVTEPCVKKSSQYQRQCDQDYHIPLFPVIAQLRMYFLLFRIYLLFFLRIRNDPQRFSRRRNQILILLCFEQQNCQYNHKCRYQETPFEIFGITRIPEISAYQRSDKRTDIHPHIKNGVPGIKPFISGLIKLSHQR